jgi:STE24 endopeptidase
VPSELSAGRYFSAQEVARARAYHRPLYGYLAARSAAGFGYLAVIAFTVAGDWLSAPVDDLPLWAYGLAYPAVVIAVGAVIRLPLSLWRHRYERRWGFSTQSLAAWLGDWTKGVAISAALSGLALWALVELASAFPVMWPAAAAPGAALLVVLLSFIGPVVLEPVFNRFRPLEDETVAAELRALSERAGVPVRQVLVSDASRRTTKHNAYVSGLGSTRRVVLFDTLLARASPREVLLVVAHELGHRRDRHVALGTALGALGAAVAVVLLWLLVRWDPLLGAIDASGATDPRIAPFLMLLSAIGGFLTLPLGNAISRRWEAAADQASIELTRDREGFVEMERNLALANLSDLEPSRLVYVLLFSHPSPPERIDAAMGTQITETRPTTG